MSDRMPKIDLNKLSPSDREFIERIQKSNLERVANLQRVRRNNRITGCILGAVALSIYGYTIYSVNQEKFLDDFDVPETTSTIPNKQ